MKILLVGAGQIGSRHLQGLGKSGFDVEITIVEPNLETVKIAIERLNEVNDGLAIRVLNHINEIAEDFDLGIICTPADIRAEVVLSLLAVIKLKALILEKVLFQKVSDFTDVKAKIDELSIPTWVNCARRLMEPYQVIKKHLKDNPSLSMNVVGNGWGIGCNGIHFIDIFEFLTGKVVTQYSNKGLEKSSFPAKRDGYREFRGTLTGFTEDGSSIQLIDSAEYDQGLSIYIRSETGCWVVDEARGKIIYYDLCGGEIEQISVNVLYLSDLAPKYLYNLVNTNDTGLTSYDVSMAIHIPFIKTLMSHLEEENDHQWQYCPIT